MTLLKMGLRAGCCLALVLAHGWLGRWLGGLDVITELVSGDRLLVGLALLMLAPLRLLVWFVAPVWLVSGTLCDLWALSLRFRKTG